EQEHITQHECDEDQDCLLDETLTCVLAKDAPPHDKCFNHRFSYTLLALPITAIFNTTGLDSPLQDATHGMRVSFSVTPTFSIGNPNAKFFITQATGSLYFDLKNLGLNDKPGRSVLA